MLRVTPGARADRGLLQASAPSSSVTPANTSLPDLTATQAIARLCARDVTSVEYVQALFDRYDSGGFECLNAFVSLNRTKVKLKSHAIMQLQCNWTACADGSSGLGLRPAYQTVNATHVLIASCGPPSTDNASDLACLLLLQLSPLGSRHTVTEACTQ